MGSHPSYLFTVAKIVKRIGIMLQISNFFENYYNYLLLFKKVIFSFFSLWVL